MIRYLIKKEVLVFLGIFILGFFFGILDAKNITGKAEATKWGNAPGCVSDADHKICPSGAGASSYCVDSADFYIRIQGTNIPIGQQMAIDIGPADGTLTCSDVNCLKRTTHFTTGDNPYTSSGYPGGTWYIPVLDQIGCSSGICNNTYNVNVSFYAINDPNLNCAAPPTKQVTVQNGGSYELFFPITCLVPSPSPTVCPTVPTVIPTITCPNCQ